MAFGLFPSAAFSNLATFAEAKTAAQESCWRLGHYAAELVGDQLTPLAKPGPGM